MVFSKQLILQLKDQLHFIVIEVKLTFFEFPFAIPCSANFEAHFTMPDLITLSAMKVFALNGIGKWKDYVDLYFIIKHHFTVTEITVKAKDIFDDVFNPILFRKQLCYFNDINYSEQVEFLPEFETDEQTIKDFLTNAALSGF